MKRIKRIVLMASICFVGSRMEAQEYLLAQSFGGLSTDIGHAVAVDADGNVYFTGTFKSTADFDPVQGLLILSRTEIMMYSLQKQMRTGIFYGQRI